MKPPAVKVPVVAVVSVDCIFWPDADGWTGACAELSLSVNGVDFEQSGKIWRLLSRLHKQISPGKKDGSLDLPPLRGRNAGAELGEFCEQKRDGHACETQ